MKATFSVVYLLMLLGLLLGCSETDHGVVNNSLQPLQSAFHESVPSSVTEEFTPFPTEPHGVAAAPMALPLLAVVPIITCGATAIDLASLALGTPGFLSNGLLMPMVSTVGMFCPWGGPSVKSVKILKKSSTLMSRLKGFKLHKGNYKPNFERFIGRPVNSTKHQVHHTIPQIHREAAQKAGINIDQPWFLTELRNDFHKVIHNSNYGTDWKKFFRINRSADEILIFQQEMVSKYKLKPGSYLEVTW